MGQYPRESRIHQINLLQKIPQEFTILSLIMKAYVAVIALLVAFSAPGNAENLAQKAGSLGLSTLVNYLTQANLADTVANLPAGTVFGPSNAAFAALPQDIVDKVTSNATFLSQLLQYHVIASEVRSSALSNEQLAPSVDGRDIRINIYGSAPNQVFLATGARINLSQVDQEADNGVIHVMNDVIIPPDYTVTGYAVANSDFDTLKTAVVTAELDGTLNGAGPFTVFAPNNKAFSDDFTADEINRLLADKDELTKVLQLHVVSGTFYSAALSDGMKVPTLGGAELTVGISGSTVTLTDPNGGTSQVIVANVPVTNGVIHAINSVLVPEGGVNPSGASAAAAGLLTTLIAALVARFL